MSAFVTKTLQPQYADHSIYFCFDNKNNQDQKQTNKRPAEPTSANQETETKTKEQKKETKVRIAKRKASTPLKNTPTTKKKKVTERSFIS